MATLTSTNPYTQEINATFETLTNDEVDTKILAAHDAQRLWKNLPKSEKKELFLTLAETIERDIENIAKLQTIEMGMLFSASVNGLKGTISLIRWFAHNFERLLAPEPITEEGLTGHLQYDPLGVIFGIAPWNFPYNQVLRAAVPTILAGNTIVYKHASNVPLCAQMLEDLFHKAEFPEGIYTNLFVSSSKTEYIIAHPMIRWVNLTGGEWAGKTVGSLAGKYLKPSILELGGNDAFIVLDHADVDKMVASASACRLTNAGQRCNASKRFIVMEKHYEVFCQKLAHHMAQVVVGDPMKPTTQLGPLAKADLVEEVDRQVKETIAQGAQCLTGGHTVGGLGNLYAPTVLADVTPAMTSYKEEVFWPVASVIKSKDIEDSIRIANDSEFGLCACVYGDDPEQCRTVAAQIEAGMVFINAPAGSKASLPFGGVKKSGYGKENGPEGLRAFTNKKAVLY